MRSGINEIRLAKLGFARIEDEDLQSGFQAGFDCLRLYQGKVPLFIRARDPVLGSKRTLVFDSYTGHVWKADDHFLLQGTPFNYRDVTVAGVPLGFLNLKFQKPRLPPG